MRARGAKTPPTPISIIKDRGTNSYFPGAVTRRNFFEGRGTGGGQGEEDTKHREMNYHFFISVKVQSLIDPFDLQNDSVNAKAGNHQGHRGDNEGNRGNNYNVRT